MSARKVPARSGAAATGPLDPQAQFLADIAELRARLTAVTTATFDASNVIISDLEGVMAEKNVGATHDLALDALSACVFHDIVGQHIARAAELLAVIEKLGPPTETESAEGPRPTRRDLVNGPALDPLDGLDQGAVDGFFK